MNHWMFRCKDVSRMVSESMDRDLPFHRRLAVRMHLFMCKLCSENRRQFLIIREAMRLRAKHTEEVEPGGTLSPEARERIKCFVCKK